MRIQEQDIIFNINGHEKAAIDLLNSSKLFVYFIKLTWEIIAEWHHIENTRDINNLMRAI